MFIGHFTEQPWQDSKTGLMGTDSHGPRHQ